MKKTKKNNASAMVGAVVLCLAIPFLAAPASAKDFTFNIPVELKNIDPSLTHFHIAIVVKAKNYSNYVASVWKRFPIVNGKHSGIVTIECDALAGMDPAKADSWEVSLAFAKNNSMSDVKLPSQWEELYSSYAIDRSGGFREKDNGAIVVMPKLK